ncbi:MAG: TPM domain-containing protein [Sulfuritalea sp.]|nr:TPM domain-containing protein [Sulfuritalea sp.]
MRRACAGLLTLLWLALLPAIGWAAEPVLLPGLTARVTDLTATLDATQRGRLEAQLAAIDRAGRAQIAVLLLPTIQPETIEQFGIRLAEAWKVGHKGIDNGVIVIVAKNDRKMRIEVGYGLEGAIPDAIAKRIIAERMTPAFKQNDFFGGLRAAIEALDQAIGGPASGAAAAIDTAPAVARQDAGGEHLDWISWLFMTLVAGGVLRMMFGLLGSLAAAAIGGWLGFMVFGSLALAIGAGVLIFLLSFVNLFSGGGRGGFGGSSSGGGFSGGGGSFGGGGASGNW